MDYQYVVRAEDNRVVKGKLTASSEESAVDMLTYGGGNGLSKIRNRVKETITGDPASAARLLQQWIGQKSE